jgi:hypothetical protein
MLSYLDRIIFPNRCEVLEIIPSQRYVYPIFKNGSSSLHKQAEQSNWRVKINEQISRCHIIHVVIRDPQERFVSGVNTFIQWTMRDHPDLDINTVSWFAQQYLFLDRHYATQFMWLLNLARYLGPDAKLCFLSMLDFDQLTQIHKPPGNIQPATESLITQIKQSGNYEMYQRLDTVIYNYCVGKTMTFAQVITELQTQDPAAYDFVVGHCQHILKPTYALPQT